MSSGIYSDEYSKPDKQALRKGTKFFWVKDGELLYIGEQRANNVLTELALKDLWWKIEFTISSGVTQKAAGKTAQDKLLKACSLM